MTHPMQDDFIILVNDDYYRTMCVRVKTHLAGDLNPETLRSYLDTQWRFLGQRSVVIEGHFSLDGENKVRRIHTPSVDTAWEAIQSAHRGKGVYLFPQQISPESFPLMEDWDFKNGIRADTIESVTTTYIDIDVVKSDKHSMATTDEVVGAQRLALLIYRDLCCLLGSEAGLGYMFSGNGAQIWIAHDPIPALAAKPYRVALLRGVEYVYADNPSRIDCTVSDVRRIGPLAGSMKRKGVATAERPHRAVGFWAPVPGRVPGDNFIKLCKLFESKIPPPKPQPPKRQYDGDYAYGAADLLPIEQVSLLCGGTYEPYCFACKANHPDAGKSKNGGTIWMCLHNTCRHVRPAREQDPSLPTIWSPLLIVMYTQKLKHRDAYNWLRRHFPELPALTLGDKV